MTDPAARLTTALAGRYRIERELGAGGMATVYLAHDVRHDRPVAVKVLRSDLAAVIGVERFLAEIKTTAQLQHAHILGLIDSGEVDGTAFYVMPFVDGESLRARLAREKQIAIPDAVRIATAVAGALDYAHRRGVIHRDIKPENILLHEGQPVVADFGIALAVSRSGAGARTGSRMTESGMSLGTPQYMSPEQAAGERNLDARTDIYSLGCVLYEMLTGEPPFSGPTAQAIIAKVMTVEPQPVTTLRRSVPANVAAATMTALNKVPADRFANAAEFAAALANPQFVSPEVAARRAASRLPQFTARELAGATVIVALAVVAAMGWMRRGSTGSSVVAEIPYDVATSGAQVHFTPDGSALVWSAGNAYWTRRIDSLGVRRLRDAATAQGIRDMSPDGREVLLAGRGGLAIASLAAGSARELPVGSGGRGATWGADGYIYFAFGASTDPKHGIARIAASGGVVDTLATLTDSSVIDEIVALPGGRGVIVARGYRNNVDSIAAFDVRSKKWTTLALGGAPVRYVRAGYLLFGSVQYLMAAPFDAQRLELSQPPAPFIEVGTSVAALAASEHVLVYQVSADPQGAAGIELRPRMGSPRALLNVPEGIRFSNFSVSPDGKRFVATGAPAPAPGISAAVQQQPNLYVYQLPAGPMQRFPSSEREGNASWIPDTRDLAFVRYLIRDTLETSTLMRRPWDGSAPPDTIISRSGRTGRAALIGMNSWFGASRAVVQVAGGQGGGRGGGRGPGSGSAGGAGQGGDLLLLTLGRQNNLTPLVGTEFAETNPAVSPDGRLLAYQSNSSGRSEVYVGPIDGSARRRVSLNGGTLPKWSRTGGELFFRVNTASPGDTLYAARIQGGTDLSVGDIKAVLTGVNLSSGYASLPGDTLFVMRPSAADARRPFIIVTNFVQRLDRLFGKK